MIRKPTNNEIERLEESAKKDKNGLSNLELAIHITEEGTFYYRLVCELEKNKTKDETNEKYN